jgi:quinol monooxygenase YgiN
MICVVASIELAAGQREKFVEIMHKLVPHVRAEPGCLEYAPMLDAQTEIPAQRPVRDSVVTVIEKWQSVAALETHLTTRHMKEFFQATELMRVGVSLQILQPA